MLEETCESRIVQLQILTIVIDVNNCACLYHMEMNNMVTSFTLSLLQAFGERGYMPSFSLSLCSDCHNQLGKKSGGEGTKRFVLLDNVMGDVRLQRNLYDKCKSYVHDVQHVWEQNHFNVLLVMTMYPNILSETEQVCHEDEKLATRTVVHFLKQDPFQPSLPFIPRMEGYIPFLTRILRDPKHSNAFACLLALTMEGIGAFLQNQLSVEKCMQRLGFKDTVSCHDLTEVCVYMGGVVFRELEQGFLNRDIYNASALALNRVGATDLVLRVCDAQFLMDFVRIDADVKSTMMTNVLTLTTLQQRNLVLERMSELIIQHGAAKELSQHSSLSYQNIVQEFSNICTRKKCTDQLISAVDTNHKLPMLYWSLWRSSHHLTHWCLSCMKQSITKSKDLSVAAFSSLLACILFSKPGDSTFSAAKQLVKAMSGVQLKHREEQGKFSLPLLGQSESVTTGKMKQVRARIESGVCYLGNGAFQLPSSLLTMKLHDKSIYCEVSYRQWYLLLRLLTDEELDEVDDDGDAVLHIASDNDNIEVVRMLLRMGASIKSRNEADPTPHGLAVKKNRDDIRRMPTFREDKHSRTLMLACRFNDLETVKALQCQGITFQMKDGCRNTPLHLASRENHREMVSHILQHDVGPNETNGEGKTPLHLASGAGHLAAADLLLQRRADTSIKDLQGNTPLHLACMNGRWRIAELLIKNGADVNCRNRNGASPLYLASQNGRIDATRVLLQNQADINAVNGEEKATALHAACRRRHEEVVRLLLKHDADLGIRDAQGHTPVSIVRDQRLQGSVFEQIFSRFAQK